MRGALRLTALTLPLLVMTSCVQLSWQRHHELSVVTAVDEEALIPREASLADCLSRLGAPLLVWEQTDTSYAIAYGWDRQRDFGISVSVPVADSGGSASLNYNDIASKLRGVVFIFDEQDLLVRKRRGFLRDLAPDSAQATPAFLEEE